MSVFIRFYWSFLQSILLFKTFFLNYYAQYSNRSFKRYNVKTRQNPWPYPPKTRTRDRGYGFSRVRVGVAPEYPRVTPANP
jgi:hypothetical protein